MGKPTDGQLFLAELDGGVFLEKLSHALSDVAAGVVDHNKAGKVQLTFDMKRLGDSYQVVINHKIVSVKPTSKGKVAEENTTTTPMHVGKGGRVTFFPENQVQMFDLKGEVNSKAGEKV